MSVGDQILSIDETVIENTALSPDDVMAILDANTSKGYTQIQIMPSHAIMRRGNVLNKSNIMMKKKNSKIFLCLGTSSIFIHWTRTTTEKKGTINLAHLLRVSW